MTKLITVNGVIQFALAHFLSSKSSFHPLCLKSTQSDMAVFNYYFLEIANRFINKVIDVLSCVI